MTNASLTQVNDCTWQLSGEVLTETVMGLMPDGERGIDAASGELIFDLSGITQSDSAAVALLLAWLRYALQQKKQMRIVNMPAEMQDVVKVSGLQEILSL